MPPINLGSKHQDLLKAYLEVSKGDKPDWTGIATKANYPSAKYARDQFTILKGKLLATRNGDAINLSDRHIALLKATLEVMKADTDWDKVARVANFKTPKYARDQWTIVKYKLTGTIITKERKSNVTPSRKRKEREDDNSGEELSASPVYETPAKKSKKPTRQVKVEETEVEASNEDDDEHEQTSAGQDDTPAQVSKNRSHKTNIEEAEQVAATIEDVAPLSVQEEADEQIKKELQDAAELFETDEMYNAEMEEYVSLI